MGLLHAAISNAISGGRVIAICEQDRLLASMGRRIIPNVKFFDTLESMIAEARPEVIFVTTPTHTHLPVIERLVKGYGNPAIFCEKPLGASFADAKRAVDVTRQMITMVGFQKRYSPMLRLAKELIDKQAIGEILFFKASIRVTDVLNNTSGWRYSRETGGALRDLGPHLVDILLWFFGKPKSVQSLEGSFFTEGDDYSHAAMTFPSKIIGTLEVCWSVRNYRLPELSLEINGRQGTLNVSDDSLDLYSDHGVKGLVKEGHQTYYKAAISPSVEFLLGDQEYTLEDRQFLDAVVLDKTAHPDFETASQVNELIDLIHAKGME